MPLTTPLDEIVTFVRYNASNGLSHASAVSCPMMLAEAVRRALEALEAGGQPSIIIRGVTYSDPEFFRAISQRSDFPK